MELQQQQQKRLKDKGSTFKYYSASEKFCPISTCERGPLTCFRSGNCEHMVEALTLPVTLEMAGKPLVYSKWEGLVGGEMYCLCSPERGNRWGRAPVVGPTGHFNKQIAHLHL